MRAPNISVRAQAISSRSKRKADRRSATHDLTIQIEGDEHDLEIGSLAQRGEPRN
jgi:hypothetical protein